MIFSIEKKGAEEEVDDDEAGGEDDDEQVDGDIEAEEVEGDGEEEDVDGSMEVVDDDVKIGGRFEIRSLGLGLPCLQGKLRNLVKEEVLKKEV